MRNREGKERERERERGGEREMWVGVGVGMRVGLVTDGYQTVQYTGAVITPDLPDYASQWLILRQ